MGFMTATVLWGFINARVWRRWWRDQRALRDRLTELETDSNSRYAELLALYLEHSRTVAAGGCKQRKQ